MDANVRRPVRPSSQQTADFEAGTAASVQRRSELSRKVAGEVADVATLDFSAESIAVIGIGRIPNKDDCDRQEVTVLTGRTSQSSEILCVVALPDDKIARRLPSAPALVLTPASRDVGWSQFQFGSTKMVKKAHRGR
jgi:hypothetical protein